MHGPEQATSGAGAPPSRHGLSHALQTADSQLGAALRATPLRQSSR
jgi:hypothetical protein